MHIEFLVEDQSGEILLKSLVPKILGEFGNPHSWNIHGYKGIGNLPVGLQGKIPSSKRILLDRLPSLLRGYGKTPGIDHVVVVLDNDDRDCAQFLRELNSLLATCRPAPATLFRLALEEIEAWYLGDWNAITKAYPGLRFAPIMAYQQDSCCGTWELLADAIHPGGATKLKKAQWPIPGRTKCEWAEKIGPHLDIARNDSPSFNKFVEGLSRILDPKS